MAMPGFNAETSLYQTSEHYKTLGASEALTGSAEVVPQACVNIGPCRVCVTASLFPPRACLTFSCLGFNRSFCVP
jgi:hypothetical protein